MTEIKQEKLYATICRRNTETINKKAVDAESYIFGDLIVWYNLVINFKQGKSHSLDYQGCCLI